MTDQERRHVVDLLAAHEALIHWCETLISAGNTWQNTETNY